MTLESHVFKMHLPVELDPDFGNAKPSNGHGFVLSVYKRKYGVRKFKYEFILLIPCRDLPEEDIEILLDEVTEIFLERNEDYKIRDLCDEDVDEYTKDTPVLSFHPKSVYDEKIGFFWQKPPKHLTH